MDDAIIKLQEALYYQGEEIARLSGELIAQQKEIARLHELLGKLREGLEEGPGIRSLDEETPPPHY